VDAYTMDAPDRLVLDGYIGSQVLQALLAYHNLVLTRGGRDELSVVPSNIAMASVPATSFLVPIVAVNNMLLSMGLCLTRLPNGGYDIREMTLFNDGTAGGELRLPGDEVVTRAFRTQPI
jgi:hypothetical protein